MCDRTQLVTGLDRLSLQLDNPAIERLLTYCQELQRWNRRINLIARNTPASEVMERHFLDSLTLIPLLHRHGGATRTLLDVGTGAGFPGLVLAAALPDLMVTLVEPRQKRTAFLRHIVRTLGLTNVQVLEQRLEANTTLPGPGLQFSFITSRALAAPEDFLPLVAQLAGQGALVILMLAERLPSRLPPDWEVADTVTCTLPFSGHPRRLAALRRGDDPGKAH